MAHLAANNEDTISGRQLADELNSTQHFLPQVMKPLVGLNYVASSPGPTGGYRLTANLAETTLMEVIEAIEGPFDLGQCISTGKPCPTQEPCALHIPWTRAMDAVLAELGSVTLDVMGTDSVPEG
ncbi:MAG: Rrf2 family transcriptional regulator [bacterium]|nr:Rrf2 family transcriptional regulator [bacterium]MCP4964565.1 Rrf2 family transcriptional regulator [bacterium]